MSEFFLARQPIYDAQLKVAGYELLFRAALDSTSAHVIDGDRASSEVIVNALVDIGLEAVVGDLPAYINITQSFLDGSVPLPELKGQIVLEILEDIEPSPEVVAAVERLTHCGYRFALDDFEFRPEFDPLLKLVDIVKLDIMALGKEGLAKQVEILRPYKVQLLAEKVETYEEFEWCKELGMETFQGYFFCRPKVISGQRPDANRLIVLELLKKLQDIDSEFNDIEKLISSDAALSYRLLRYINSAYFTICTEVTSIRRAVMLTGMDTIRQWATLLMMARLSESKPAELLTVGLIRAKMCELVGALDVDHQPHEYFTVGLFSILEALLDQPMENVLSDLPLHDETKCALANFDGPLGTVLHDVIEYERAPFPIVGVENPTHTYLEAVSWTKKTLGSFAA